MRFIKIERPRRSGAASKEGSVQERDSSEQDNGDRERPARAGSCGHCGLLLEGRSTSVAEVSATGFRRRYREANVGFREDHLVES